MLVTKIPDLLEMSEGAKPEATTGIITKIAKRMNAGKGENASTMQFAHLTGDGKTIKLVLWGRDELPSSYNGKKVFLTCFQGQRGPTGLSRKDYDKNGDGKDIEPQLWVYDKADVAFEDGSKPEPETQQREPEQRQQSAPPPKQQQTGGTGTVPDKYADGINKAKVEAMKLANLYAIACNSANESHKAVGDEKIFPLAQIPNTATTIFIQLARENYHTQLPANPALLAASSKNAK